MCNHPASCHLINHCAKRSEIFLSPPTCFTVLSKISSLYIDIMAGTSGSHAFSILAKYNKKNVPHSILGDEMAV